MHLVLANPQDRFTENPDHWNPLLLPKIGGGEYRAGDQLSIDNDNGLKVILSNTARVKEAIADPHYKQRTIEDLYWYGLAVSFKLGSNDIETANYIQEIARIFAQYSDIYVK